MSEQEELQIRCLGCMKFYKQSEAHDFAACWAEHGVTVTKKTDGE